MSPREIIFRAREQLILHTERIAYYCGWYQWPNAVWQRRLCQDGKSVALDSDLATWWLAHMQNREEPPFLLDNSTVREAASLYETMFPHGVADLLTRADAACDGRFAFLGIEFRVGRPVDWQQDPVTHRRWPSRFYADIHIPFCEGEARDSDGLDAKHVWELNRHEFLIGCAQAFCLTRQPKYASHFFQTVTSWASANPYKQGINWAGPLEVAVRAMSWLWSYQLCRTWSDIDPHDHLIMIKSFYQHGTHLYRHLEVYFSPNNHLVGEALALYLLGSFFPEFDEAAAWRSRGWDVLVAASPSQFYADGGSTEQSTSYHHYCLGFLVLAVLTRQKQRQSVPVSMLERLERAFEFSMWMTTPDGTVPGIGDSDDSRSIRFGGFRPWDFRNLLSLGAMLFHRSDMKAVAGPMSEDTLWLSGASGYATYRELEAAAPETHTRLFPKSGYAILRSGWGQHDDHVCFDCGPIGSGMNGSVPVTTHGHADMLSVTFSTHGKPVLVDSGFYTFSGCPLWHRYCRDVQGHNTIRVDGGSQGQFERFNAWSQVAEPGPITMCSDPDFEFVGGSHSGFRGVDGCVCHRRALFYKQKSYLVVLDRLEGSGRRFVEAFFHFAPGVVRELPDGYGVSIRTDKGIFSALRTINDSSLEVEIRHGQGKPSGGWIASGYGSCEPAPLVRFFGYLDLPTSLVFVLKSAVSPCDTEFTVSMNREPSGQWRAPSRLQIRSRHEEDLLAIDWDTTNVSRVERDVLDSDRLFASSSTSRGGTANSNTLEQRRRGST